MDRHRPGRDGVGKTVKGMVAMRSLLSWRVGALRRKFQRWWRRPFPFRPMDRWAAVGVATFVYGFLWVFEPFGIDDMPGPWFKARYLAGFWVITWLGMTAVGWWARRWARKAAWTVGRELTVVAVLLGVIAGVNWLYHEGMGYGSRHPHGFLAFVGMTVAVGVFPTAFWIIWQLRKEGRPVGTALPAPPEEPRPPNGPPRVQLGLTSDPLVVPPMSILCIKAEGNYIRVYYRQGPHVRSSLVRGTLRHAEARLGGVPSLRRCHRSYIVNFRWVKQVQGNARNFRLRVEGLDFEVPVSRNLSRGQLEGWRKAAGRRFVPVEGR